MKLIYAILLFALPASAQTYLHPQAQKFLIAQQAAGYTPTGANVNNAHHLGLHLLGACKDEGVTYLDLTAKLDMQFPIIGSTASSQGIDFIRLTAGTFIGSPTIGVDRFTCTGSGYFQSNYTPTANQTNYHLSVYSNTNEIASNKVDIGNSAGQTQFLAGLIKQTLTAPSGSGATNIFATTGPSSTFTAVASTIGGFIFNRPSSTQEQEFANGVQQGSTITHNTTNTTPGVIWVGRDANVSTAVSTKSYSFAGAGKGLTSAEAASYYSAVIYKINH